MNYKLQVSQGDRSGWRNAQMSNRLISSSTLLLQQAMNKQSYVHCLHSPVFQIDITKPASLWLEPHSSRVKLLIHTLISTAMNNGLL